MAGAPRWLARGEHELPDDLSWLAPGEIRRASGMRFAKRRTEYLLRRWAGKQAVAAVTGASTDLPALSRIEVANRMSGAPYVLVDDRPVGLDVSLTDRAGWAVCVVGDDLSRVGCDVELVEPRSDGFAADYLTAAEQGFVATRPPGESRDEAVNLLWSAKESALKVLQTGLRRDTRTVDVTVEEVDPGNGADRGWGRLLICTTEGTDLTGWWRRDGSFLLTVAAASHLPAPTVLPGSAALASATPVHSWVREPIARDWPLDEAPSPPHLS